MCILKNGILNTLWFGMEFAEVPVHNLISACQSGNDNFFTSGRSSMIFSVFGLLFPSCFPSVYAGREPALSGDVISFSTSYKQGLWEYLLALHKVEKFLKPVSVHLESLMNQDPGNSFASLECR